MSSKGKPISCSGGPVTSDVKGNSGKASYGKNLKFHLWSVTFGRGLFGHYSKPLCYQNLIGICYKRRKLKAVYGASN